MISYEGDGVLWLVNRDIGKSLALSPKSETKSWVPSPKFESLKPSPNSKSLLKIKFSPRKKRRGWVSSKSQVKSLGEGGTQVKSCVTILT